MSLAGSDMEIIQVDDSDLRRLFERACRDIWLAVGAAAFFAVGTAPDEQVDLGAIHELAEWRIARFGRLGNHVSLVPSFAAFLQGKVSGATSPKGPFAQAKAVFRGVAPARPGVRLGCAGRPARIRNPLPDKALMRPRLFRRGCERGLPLARTLFRQAIFPETANGLLRAGRTTVPCAAGGTR